jgi:hypothetical protein
MESGKMTNDTGFRRYSHLAVRTVTLLTMADFVLVMSNAPYYSQTITTLFRMLTSYWYVVSSVALPIYVGFEVWWMRKAKVENRPLWIDATLVFTWFVLFWVVLIYGLLHRPFL